MYNNQTKNIYPFLVLTILITQMLMSDTYSKYNSFKIWLYIQKYQTQQYCSSAFTILNTHQYQNGIYRTNEQLFDSMSFSCCTSLQNNKLTFRLNVRPHLAFHYHKHSVILSRTLVLLLIWLADSLQASGLQDQPKLRSLIILLLATLGQE
jgi:hypothetical protein